MSRYRATTPHGEQVTAETMQQLREAVREAIGKRSVRQAAGVAECGEATLYRILRGENVTLQTVCRIVEALGGRIEIRVVDKNCQM